MRTAVELPASLRQKLVTEAARRNVRGYSGIIVEALELFFDSNASARDSDLLKTLRGSMSSTEYGEAVTALNEGRSNWRT